MKKSDEQQKYEEEIDKQHNNSEELDEKREIFKDKVGNIAKKYQHNKTPKINSLYIDIYGLLVDFKKELSKLSENTPYTKLYQYKPCKFHPDTGKNYMLDQVATEKNYLNYPSKFDDMFDSCVVIDSDQVDSKYNEEILACILSIQLAKLKENKLISQDNNGWDNLMFNLKKEADKCLKIASFCTSCSNTPLWYYYAGQNKGVCFEYNLKDILQSLGNNDFLVPVIYTDKFYKYNPFTFSKPNNNQSEEIDNNTKATLIANSFVKHKDWKFENEWRIIRIFDGDPESEDTKFIKIPIESIIFGKDMIDENKENINKKKVSSQIGVKSMKQTIFGLIPV